MKRSIWFVLAGIGVVIVGFSLVALPRGEEWTTASPGARAEVEGGVQALMKLYTDDAERHFSRALELDPGFVIAKLFLAESIKGVDNDRAEELLNEAIESDLERLSARECLLIRRVKALYEKRGEDAGELVDTYLDRHPNDPYVLNIKAQEAWARGEHQLAERLYRRLVEISPNWVIAYNMLGYITMVQGRFAEAEEYFKSYRFVAPDQANPHDSLGELFVVLGRLDEATVSFEKAVQIKPEFWASYDHLVMVHNLRGDAAAAHEVIARAASVEGCPGVILEGMRCSAKFAELERGQAWKWILGEAESGCFDSHAGGYVTVVTHRAACRMGRWEVAGALEQKVRERSSKESSKAAHESSSAGDPLLLHLEGVRLALQDRLDEAVARLREVDGLLTYRDSGIAVFKLYNSLCLVEALRAADRPAAAHKLLAQVREVNPVMAGEFEDRGFENLGIERTR